MKQFIYFFKHTSVNAVKIGRTSGESVESRFCSFKVCSPFGAEILGFYECDNAVMEEKRLHQKYSQWRLAGEFFDITMKQVEHELSDKNSSYSKAINAINELQALGLNINQIKLFADRQIKLISAGSKKVFTNKNYETLFNELPDTFKVNDCKNISEINGVKFGSFKMWVIRNRDILFISKGSGFWSKIIP